MEQMLFSIIYVYFQHRKMEENGEEVIVLAYRRQNGACSRFGTEKGLAFANKRSDLETAFLSFVSGMHYFCHWTLHLHVGLLN